MLRHVPGQDVGVLYIFFFFKLEKVRKITKYQLN